MGSKQIRRKNIFPIAMMGFLFVLIHGLALLAAGPFEAADMHMFEEEDNPMNIALIFGIIIVITAVLLLIAKYWLKQVIQFIILGAVWYTSAVVFNPLFDLVIPTSISISIPVASDTILVISASVILSIIVAVILVLVLIKFPEWYVIDICGIVIGAGAIALFGISLGVFLVIILLIILAVYDAISVYKTKHMIELADTVVDLKLPVLLVIPKIRKYSLLKETKRLKEKLKDDEERDAFFMGLGDVVMPGILVVAAYHSIPDGLPIALSVMLGTLFGFAVLMTFVIKGKPQAGLPSLCGGAILGYVISSYLLFGSLTGINVPF